MNSRTLKSEKLSWLMHGMYAFSCLNSLCHFLFDWDIYLASSDTIRLSYKATIWPLSPLRGGIQLPRSEISKKLCRQPQNW